MLQYNPRITHLSDRTATAGTGPEIRALGECSISPNSRQVVWRPCDSGQSTKGSARDLSNLVDAQQRGLGACRG